MINGFIIADLIFNVNSGLAPTVNKAMPADMTNYFDDLATRTGYPLDSKEFAKYLDGQDKFHHLRDKFIIPRHPNNPQEEAVYLVGNSLGPQPRGTQELLTEELQVWSEMGHLGHTRHTFGRHWVEAGEDLCTSLARLVGATGSVPEAIPMGTLTGNLHQLMCAFYRPTEQRYKIIIEDHAFPSDHVPNPSLRNIHEFSMQCKVSWRCMA